MARKNRKKKKTEIILAALALSALFVLGCIKVWDWYSDNRLPNFRYETVLFVRPDTSVDEVYAALINEAGVKRPYSLDHAFREKKVAEFMQPGRYEIKPSYTSVYVARMLNNCWQSPARLVLSGTMRLKTQLAGKISSQLMIDSIDALSALNNKALLSYYGFTPVNVFSLFIPDTYEMFWTSTMEDVLSKQKEAYDAFWTAERQQKAKVLGMTKQQVSILASIVKGETNCESEMPKIAGVYLNRLNRGMKLQADPTIAYCLNYDVSRILKRHLQIESPYNTYKYAGLPPGPIAVPTKASLDAVLNPDYGKGNMFFCADPSFNGTHRFARTYGEHMRNARAFQSALNKRTKEQKVASRH